jgi:signal transduction histidine kinase
MTLRLSAVSTPLRPTYADRVLSPRTPDRTPAGPAVVAVVVLAMACLVGMQLVALVVSGTSPRLLALDVAVGVVALALIPALWPRPVATTVVLGLLAALSPVATPPATMAVFHVARWHRFSAAVATALVGVAAHLVQGLWRPIDGLPYGWYALLVAVAYATLVGWGAYAQARRELLRSLAERARRAEQEQALRVAEARREERARLSREMHDVLARRLSLLSTYAGALEYRPDSSPERLSRAAGIIRGGLHEALEEIREVITILREEDDDGTGDALRPLPSLRDLPRLVEECTEAGMDISVQAPDDLAGAAAAGRPGGVPGGAGGSHQRPPACAG